MNSTAKEIENEFAGGAESAVPRRGPAAFAAASFLKRLLSFASARRREPRLRLREMLPLGEKRFVAVVEYGREKFLLAGTPHAVCLLQRWEADGGTAEAAPSLECTPGKDSRNP
jgi:flagellar biogenesis protein FliO